MIYIAAPYEKILDKEKLMRTINRINAKFLKLGMAVYSPLTIGHFAGEADFTIYDLPKEQWAKMEEEMIPLAKMLVIITLHKWDSSAGVAREKKLAIEHGIPIIYVDPYIASPTISSGQTIQYQPGEIIEIKKEK